MIEDRKNWAGNYRYGARNLHLPNSLEELQRIVKSCNKLKALGTRHSFNGIADTDGDQISLSNFDRMELDVHTNSVRVGSGVICGRLAPYLYSNGYALHNLASLPHISVVGAAATATHGSGNENGNLATAVSAIEFVAANGEIVKLSRGQDPDYFQGAVVSLGALGVVTQLTLELWPAFDMMQVVYENLSLGLLERHFDEIFSSGYSVSLFTDWQKHRAVQVWIKRHAVAGVETNVAREFFGATLASVNLNPVPGSSPENCTEQLGRPGPWHERLPHFRMDFIPSSGQELQTEYFVPRDRAFEAITAVEALRDRITPHLLITELRTVAADDLWMSPNYKRPSVGIHFTWKPEWNAVKDVLPVIEDRLRPFEARPHWGKLFAMTSSDLESLYVQLPNFRKLVQYYDPAGKFRNDFLARNLGR